MTIFEKYNQVKEINKDIRKVGMDAMERTKDYFLDANREQMTSGYDSEEKRIGVYRSDSYERLKAQMFPQSSGWVNLRYKGSFQDAMKLTVNTKIWKITSTDSKAKQLTSKYGLDIFGLSKLRMDEYRRLHFYPEFMFLIRRYLK